MFFYVGAEAARRGFLSTISQDKSMPDSAPIKPPAILLIIMLCYYRWIL